MRRTAQIFSAVVLVLSMTFYAPRAQAEPMKEFITSCTYGVLAGTLVGAASLAFTDVPGDNLNNIARGASIGLYAGIALGAYVVYGVGNGAEEDPEGEQGPSEEGGEEYPEDQTRAPMLFPMFSKNGVIDGAGISMKVLSF